MECCIAILIIIFIVVLVTPAFIHPNLFNYFLIIITAAIVIRKELDRVDFESICMLLMIAYSCHEKPFNTNVRYV